MSASNALAQISPISRNKIHFQFDEEKTLTLTLLPNSIQSSPPNHVHATTKSAELHQGLEAVDVPNSSSVRCFKFVQGKVTGRASVGRQIWNSSLVLAHYLAHTYDTHEHTQSNNPNLPSSPSLVGKVSNSDHLNHRNHLNHLNHLNNLDDAKSSK